MALSRGGAADRAAGRGGDFFRAPALGKKVTPDVHFFRKFKLSYLENGYVTCQCLLMIVPTEFLIALSAYGSGARDIFSNFAGIRYWDFGGQAQSPSSEKRFIQILNNF